MTASAEERLAAAIKAALLDDSVNANDARYTVETEARAILAADPQLAADITLGSRLRDESDPLLAEALHEHMTCIDEFWGDYHEPVEGHRQQKTSAPALLKAMKEAE